MRLLSALMSGVALLAGCASDQSQENADVRRWAQQIRILKPEQVGDRAHDVVAALEERVAISATGELDAIAEAERRMRLRAAKVDADAVVMAQCERIRDPNDWEATTTPTVGCVGYAIRWTAR